MFRIWFELTLPPEYEHLLDNAAVAIGTAGATPATPLVALPDAQAIIASAWIRYDGTLMDQAPGLRVIARMGIGYDNISIPDATARGILVCNVPEAPTISTSELAIALIFAVVKQIKRGDRDLRRGGQTDFFSNYTGRELYGLRLGLIGVGRIGSRVAQAARALGMSVVGFSPSLSDARAAELGLERAPTTEALLRSADIISLHAPITPATRHLINAEALAHMKPGAYLINTARGGLVDEAALLAALESGHLHGAGLDVFDPEPPRPDNPLLNRDDVIATPHIAGATRASKDRLWSGAISQALQALRGERPPHLVNPEVWSQAPPG